ncbi:zinc finger protein 568-like [Sitodiplosis mosellana]|uniref:zinc finger protein 568-like n=1 Tax=Sitodiplosis mosellana TaxID=263140 RepID=UPI002443BB52|nr:zinc finger protein 568-like [Sitodiplosis mosellana]
MNPYRSKGCCSSNNTKRKRKRSSVDTIVEVKVKQDVVVKEETVDKAEMVDITRPLRQPPSTEATGMVKSEAETDSEVDFEYDIDCVKGEVKSENGCVKKECGSSQGASSSDGGDNLDDIAADASNAGPRSNSREKHKRGSKRENITNQKKQTNAKASKKTAVKYNLTQHIRVHTAEKPFVCEVCARSFAWKSSFKRHEKTHGPPLAFRCSECRRGFAQDIDKTDHESKCQQRQYVCYACKHIAPYVFNLKRHMRTHSGQKPFGCSVCSRIFAEKAKLRDHSRTHVEQLPLACSKCAQRFAEANEERSHEKRCIGRRFECYLCQYECFQKSHLKYHMRSKHTGDKPFKCAVCEMEFCQKFGLERHLATHTKPHPIRCSKCWVRFTDEDKKNVHEAQCNRRLRQCYLCKVNTINSIHLKNHMRAQHTGEKPFQCELCGARFVRKFDTARHMTRHHGLNSQI